MIVEKIDRTVINSCNAVQRRFRIDESGIVNILTILRKSMYSNPTRIIVQEYANNARDAHVAAKTPQRPIHITCPTAVSPYLKIRDYGNGIPPELVDEVFVVYGASTKRDTNEQIGGFGLGAKSAFSYCDAFEVTTICNGLKYIYAPHIDESDIGEMPLIAVEETDEPTGTLISIPIKDSDIYAVNDAITLITEYWDIRPEVTGSPNYSNRKVYFSESNWSLMEKSYSWQDNEILYCVEGIPYTFAIPASDERFSKELKELANCPFVVKLKTGDVTIASNRESLVSDEKTLSKIKEILDEINDHFRNHVMESIEKCDKLSEMFELRAMYNKLRLDHMVRSFVWKGITISGNHLTIPNDIGHVSRLRLTKRGDEEGRGYSVKVIATGQEIDFDTTTRKHIFTHCIEEGKTFNRNQVLNAMLTNGTMLECQLISLRVPEDDPVLETCGFQYFNKTSLSIYPTKNLWRSKLLGGVPTPKVEYYNFQGPCHVKSNNWRRTVGEIDDLEEGVYFKLFRGKAIENYEYEFFDAFNDCCKLPIYGIPPRSVKDAIENENLVDHITFLNSYCDGLMSRIKDNEYAATIVCGDARHCINDSLARLIPFIGELPEDHLLFRWLTASKLWKSDELKEVRAAVLRYNYFAPFIGREKYNTDDSLQSIHDLATKTYPALATFEYGMRYTSYATREQMYEASKAYVEYIDTKIALESEH